MNENHAIRLCGAAGINGGRREMRPPRKIKLISTPSNLYKTGAPHYIGVGRGGGEGGKLEGGTEHLFWGIRMGGTNFFLGRLMGGGGHSER